MAEEDNETKTETPPETHHEEKPPEVHHDAHDELTNRVNGLSTKVDELTTLVSELTQQQHQDTTPVRRPWTHAGGR